MRTPDLTIEQRVSALEAALSASEQWNTCACGHHGSAHSASTNACLTCDCQHFATKRKPNDRPAAAVPDAALLAAMRRTYDGYLQLLNESHGDWHDHLIEGDLGMISAYLAAMKEPA